MSNRLPPKPATLGKLSPSWRITPLSPPTTHVIISDSVVANHTLLPGGISGGSEILTSTLANSTTSVPATSATSNVDTIHGVPSGSPTTITTTPSTQPPPLPAMLLGSPALTSVLQLITNTPTATAGVTQPPGSTLLVSAPPVTSGSVTVEGGGDVRANTTSNDSIPSITLRTSLGTVIKDFEGFDYQEIVNPILQPTDSTSSPRRQDVTLPDGKFINVSGNSFGDAIGVADHSVVVNIPPDANVGEKNPSILTSNEATKVVGDHLLTSEHLFAPWYKYACADVLLSLEPDGPSSNGTKATLHRWENFWDNGSTITYAFMKGTLVQQRKVVAVLDQWSRYANIKFEHRENLNEATIRISFEERFGSFSYIGRTIESIPRDRATMNLGWLEDELLFTDLERAVVLHEIGHTLGLSHEHASPALGGRGTLKQEAYESYNSYVIGGANKALVAGAFDAYANFELSNYLETDPGSIMKYFMPQEMNEESMQFLPNYGLSDMDLAFIMIIYPFPPVSTSVTDRWDLNHALWIAGVDGDIKERILEEYAHSNWFEIRFQFINYYTEARAARFFHGATDNQHLPSESDEFDWCCAEDTITGDGANETVAAFDENLWLPGDVITYSFVQDSKDATPYRQRRIAETYAYFSSITNLRFRKIPFDPLSPAKADIHIYFGPIPNGRSSGWSMIGTTCQGSRQSQALIHERGGTVESSMCFTDVVARTETSIGDKVEEERILYHEIAHSLGLRHERLSTVTTDFHHDRESVAIPFDLKSVMLYGDRSLEMAENWKSFKDFFNLRSPSFNHLPSVMDEALLGVLYPYPDGDVFDNFENDLRSLGLQSNLAKLSAQRDRAFSFSGRLEFTAEIGQLRRMIYDALANPAANPPSFSFLLTPSLTSATIAQSVHTPSPSPTIDKFKVMGVRVRPKATTGPFLKTILHELTKLFAPSSGQIFALQIPGRFLSQDQYAWDSAAAGIHGQSIKPAAVAESEFRLTDQLYNVGNVIGAPNGLNLSLVYERCLNNLVPSPQQRTIARQQDQVRKWLMTEIPITGWVKDLITSQRTQPNLDAAVSPETSRAPRAISPPFPTSSVNSLKPGFPDFNKLTEEGKINRMELAHALMIEYLTAKQAWELERDELILAVKNDSTDAATRRLTRITAIREGRLASKYADAVVRGQSHTVRQYLAYLDIKSAADLLQGAKDALRNSASSSLDGSMTVYPVQLQPIDWFQGLSTNFTVEDLFMNPDLIEQALDAKSKQLGVLNTQLAHFQRNPSSGHDLEELQGMIDAAQSMYDKAQVELYTTYTNNVTSLAKLCINAGGEFVMNDFVKLAKASGIADAAFLNIEQAMAKITSAQLAIAQASHAYTHVFSAKSLAQAAETANETSKITADIIALTREVDQLTSHLRALRFNNTMATTAMGSLKFASVDDIDLIPKEITPGGSRWQEVTITHTIDNPFSSDSSKEDCSFFFGSYKPDSISASGENSSLSNISSVTVDIGFRCTLVTVDRGGWFQPQFFKQSDGFYHVDERASWSKWPQDLKTTDELIAKGLHGAFDVINKYLMPTFPTGFLIAKDITIKVLQTSAEVQSSGAEFEKAVTSSNGILCWSTSSQHNQNPEKTYAYAQAHDGHVIRIPGPQIMGYMLQLTDPDMTKPIPDDLTEEFLGSPE